jgi:hypothetical protein
MGVILFAAQAGVQILAQIMGVAAQATNEEAVVIGMAFINFLINFVVQVFLQLGAIHFTLRAMRMNDTSLGNLFSLGGDVLLRGMGLSILITMFFIGILIACGLPAGVVALATQDWVPSVAAGVAGAIVYIPIAIWLFTSFALAIPLLVDRQAGVLSAMSLSKHYMQGNKLVFFLLFLITSVVGTLFTCVTCYLGLILYLPFWNLLICVCYLTATGQPFDRPTKSLPLTTSGPFAGGPPPTQ